MLGETAPTAAEPQRAPTTAQWWRAREMGREPHEIVFQVLREIRREQSARYDAYRWYARVYGSQSVAFGLRDSMSEVFAQRLTINEAANTIETLHAQIFKNRIVPAPSTDGGDWMQQQRAKDLTKWLDGAFQEVGVFTNVVPRWGMGCLQDGTGFAVVTHTVDGKRGKLVASVIPAVDVYVDEIEGRYGCPRSISYTMLVDRGVLLDLFGHADKDATEEQSTSAADRRRAINDCPSSLNDGLGYDDAVASSRHSDMLRVAFAYHLPSGPRSNDGRHVICIRTGTLAEREWKRERFPVVRLPFGVPQDSYYGMSAVGRIAPAQTEYDRLNERIQEAHDLMGVPRILKQKGAGIAAGQIDDVPGKIIDCDDINGIKEWNALPVHPEIYQYRQMIKDDMRGTLGVSGFSAQNEVPAGLQQASGVALERFEDVEQARQAQLHRNYEAAIIELAEVLIDEATELAERGIDVQVRAPAHKGWNKVAWSKVALDREEYVLELPTASALPKTPAARTEKLLQMFQQGAITQTAFNRLSELGDVDDATEEATADEDIIRETLTQIVETGEYEDPVSLDSFKLAIAIGSRFFNRCRLRKVPAERLALVAQYIDAARREDEKLNAPPPAPPGPGPGAAPGTAPSPAPSLPPGPGPIPPPPPMPPPPGMAA